ncbi:trafficking protein particle complex subunit 4-like [Paramacrobiotus metropolitanus]|uniref:trafficking protein particle complex subunit 4-like n=1 Tax=Paramacrobiotus metropolitanus TaxID=2943436 RepID=UPI002445F672|nr:trafficking protein particle complex subunit 4-like [Paramacrobiotus metropolitanus]
MVVYSLYIVNKAGGLIYHYDHNVQRNEVEKTFSYPLEFSLEFMDERLVVRFGEADNIRVGYSVLSVNGIPVVGRNIQGDPAQKRAEQEVLEFLNNPANYPVSIKFGRAPLKTNERLMLTSTFHSLYAISAQLSPEPNSSGMRTLDTDAFRLHCFQTITGTKFLILTDLKQEGADALLRKLYQIYADYALKNPFYILEMPVRFELFDENVKAAVEFTDKSGISVI